MEEGTRAAVLPRESWGRFLRRGHLSGSLKGEKEAFLGSLGRRGSWGVAGAEEREMACSGPGAGSVQLEQASTWVGHEEKGVCRGRQAQREPAEVFK